MELVLKIIFWLSSAAAVLATIGYPLLLALFAPVLRRSWAVRDAEPSVCLVIAAYNEERTIAAKLENSLSLDYPPERLQIVVASDGSSDRTDEIVRTFASRGVLLHSFPRTGKTGVQNGVASSAVADVLVFSDANAMYRSDAIRKLVRNFADRHVACVCGQLVYRSAGEGVGDCERRYWDYEKFMKRRESEISSLVGANGSIYAVRRTRYVELDKDLISDLVEPLELVRHGGRVVYEPEAISVEESSTTSDVEFRRKVRILTRSIRGLLHMRSLFNPFRYGIFSVQLFMHKLLRYLVPFFLLIGVSSLTALAVGGAYFPLFAGVFVTAGALSIAALLIPEGNRRGKWLLRAGQLLHYYVMVNTALLVAWVNIWRGKRMTVWVPERKDAQ
jgi:cellulose synthase/poly-beta-1,6-N-acetylglucosamine synthase-like glycosyltransferase